MIVDKVHQIISFKQNKWLEILSTPKRNQASNGFQKDFYKLFNNSFCGKLIEKLRNRLKIEIFENNDK